MDDWVALMEDRLGFGGCFFYTPGTQRKKKEPVAMVRKHVLVQDVFFWKGSQIFRGI